jgi:Asp-tRNA(Asn)/Glu-tRNA(Gln) amidotransferase A subunit family amidase
MLSFQVFDLWNEQDLDAVICPGFPIPAVAHKYPSLLGACGFSTAVWNMLDFPAGTVPVDHWNEDDERNLHDEKYWPVGNNFILKMMRDASTDSKGLPLGVQVIAKPYEEEKCLAVMKVVENAWKI